MFIPRINSGLKGAADSGPDGLRSGLQTPLFIRNHSHYSWILVFPYSGPWAPEGPWAVGTSPSSPSSRVLPPDGQPPDPLQRAAPTGGRGCCRGPPVRLHWSHWRWVNRKNQSEQGVGDLIFTKQVFRSDWKRANWTQVRSYRQGSGLSTGSRLWVRSCRPGFCMLDLDSWSDPIEVANKLLIVSSASRLPAESTQLAWFCKPVRTSGPGVWTGS